jgi:phosphoesterase RecJ-like protein
MMDQIIAKLNSAEKIVLASHVNPDGDAIGSLIALGKALDYLGKEVFLFNASIIPAVYRFLPFVDRIDQKIDPAVAYDTAIILDCGNMERVGEAAGYIKTLPTIINIDHHVTNSGFGHCQMIDTSACATAEIVYRLIKRMDIPIDSAIGYALYTGILTDTGSFRFSSTNQSAFAICEEMVAAGVNPYDVAQHVYGTYSLGRIKLLNLAIDSIEISKNGKLSMMTLTQSMLAETGTQPEDIDGLINYAKRIEDVRVAALIQEQKNGCHSRPGCDHRHLYHVSLRSDGTVDVAAFAAAFGGGGHSSAAGFNISTTLTELKAKIVTLSENL